MPRTRLVFLVLATAAGGCGTGREGVKPDDMSAAQHRDEAAREQHAAAEHAKDYDPHATVPSPYRPDGTTATGSSDYTFPLSVYNPTEVQLRHADEHRAHARQHEKAAQALEHFEAAECRGFPPSARAACPLLRPVTQIDDIGGGVRVTFAAGTPVHAVLAHMRCHYAYARARAFAEATSCPLYVRGIEIKPAKEPLAIEITTPDWQQVDSLRVRTREEAVYVRRTGP
jgi:hypothetical protein